MAITTLKTDPLTGDLALPVQLISGAEAVGQHVRERLQFFLGEWFLDTRQGVPYYRDVLKKNPDRGVVRSVLRRVILSCQDIATLKRLSLSFDDARRELSVDFLAVTVEDDVIDTTRLDAPFIITI